jgi:hypothetical protein
MNMAKLHRYQILSLDVWGNEKEGFEINAAYSTGRTYEIDFENDYQIIKTLFVAGEIAYHDAIDIDGNERMLHLSDIESGRPILQLERCEA